MNSSTVSKLDELPGLTGAKRIVRRLALEDARVHAVLLYGASGSGKEALAEILAQAWLCSRPTEEGADGACQACGAFGRGTTPDLLRIDPQGLSQQIVVKQITSDNPKDDEPLPLITFFRTTPLFSRHKVTIITDAHRMNGSAANALLKTLEEPHPHARLILTTDSIGSVLPTILSRCLAVACALPTEGELRSRYPEATEDDLRLAENAPGRVAQILAKPAGYRHVAEFARRLKTAAPGEALVLSDEFRKVAEKIESATGSGARAANAEALALLATFLAREPGVDPVWPQLAIEGHRRILGNGSAGIVLDALFAEMLTRA